MPDGLTYAVPKVTLENWKFSRHRCILCYHEIDVYSGEPVTLMCTHCGSDMRRVEIKTTEEELDDEVP